MHRPKLFLALALAALTLPARACLNDRDSELRMAVAGQPQLTDTIVGRFERNPPLFYELRVARVTGELKGKPQSLPLYDDIAVALDRLHRDDDAIQWMEKKRTWLEKLAPKESVKTAEGKEHWYRYHANLGTFYAHRSLRDPAHPNLADLQQAHNHIARAVAIKPEAHFGREPVQLMAIDWIREGRHRSFTAYLKERFPAWFAAQQQALQQRKRTFTHDERLWLKKGTENAAAEGLAGLVVLGAAWESVDIFAALSANLHEGLESLARLRVEELQKAGKKSLSSVPIPTKGPGYYHDEELRKHYTMLRTDADAWQKERTDYLLAHLSPTHHPDTDPSFWKDWQSRPRPTIPQADKTSSTIFFGAIMLLAWLLPIAAVVLVIRGIALLVVRR